MSSLYTSYEVLKLARFFLANSLRHIYSSKFSVQCFVPKRSQNKERFDKGTAKIKKNMSPHLCCVDAAAAAHLSDAIWAAQLAISFSATWNSLYRSFATRLLLLSGSATTENWTISQSIIWGTFTAPWRWFEQDANTNFPLLLLMLLDIRCGEVAATWHRKLVCAIVNFVIGLL